MQGCPRVSLDLRRELLGRVFPPFGGPVLLFISENVPAVLVRCTGPDVTDAPVKTLRLNHHTLRGIVFINFQLSLASFLE